jgi:hypothetical protein
MHGPAGVLRGGADRFRDHVLDPVLEPEVAVGEVDVAVLEQVGAAALDHEVLGERAATP